MLKGLEDPPDPHQGAKRNGSQNRRSFRCRKGVTRVLYPGRADHPQAALAEKQMPGGGQMIAFEVENGKQGAFRCLNALRLIVISNNLGDAKSISLTRPRRTHFRLTPAQRDELRN